MLRAWENGEHRPDGHNRQQLAKVLGADVVESGDGPEVAPGSASPAVVELKTTEFVAWIAGHSALSFQETYDAVTARTA